MKLHNTNVW